MTFTPSTPIQAVLRAQLIRAMRQGDLLGRSAYRNALAAIDNAEAVALPADQVAGAIELSPAGLGAAERPRRALTEVDRIRIVVREAVELRSAAALMAASSPDRAENLRHQERLLLDALAEAGAVAPPAADPGPPCS